MFHLVLAVGALLSFGGGDVDKPQVSIPSPEEIMSIPNELRKDFRAAVVDSTRFPETRLERLVRFVFDGDGMGVLYGADATGSVSDIVSTRKVNCLSSTILIVALAREAGLKASAQRVDRIVAWGAYGETVVQSQHVNAIVNVSEKKRYVVDVDASQNQPTDELNPISDNQLIAYFYGNRAMELMVDGDMSSAMLWMDEALKYAPGDASLLNNFAILNLKLGNFSFAEVGLLKAYRADEGQISVVSNLIFYYSRFGDQALAKKWQDRAQKILRRAPYYQYGLGVARLRGGDYEGAIKYLKRAIAIDRSEVIFRIALAEAYSAAGRENAARRELSSVMEGNYLGKNDIYRQKIYSLKNRVGL